MYMSMTNSLIVTDTEATPPSPIMTPTTVMPPIPDTDRLIGYSNIDSDRHRGHAFFTGIYTYKGKAYFIQTNTGFPVKPALPV